jgi:long-chain acyl-CoA synthetase
MEKTINEVLADRSAKYKERTAIEKKRGAAWEKASWQDYYDRARDTGLGLYSLGLRKGEMAAILSENRLEWLYADMGILGIGAVVIPIYTTLAAEEIQHILQNSGSRVLLVENRPQLEKVLEIAEQLPSLEKIVVFEAGDATGHPAVMSYAALCELGRTLNNQMPTLFAQLAREVTPDDMATIVYTSGTTGVPKGAMITHKNIMAVIHSLDSITPRFGFETDQTVPFLPLSHVFERIAGHFYGMYVGLTASYAESIDTFARDVKERRPTMILAVPQIGRAHV